MTTTTTPTAIEHMGEHPFRGTTDVATARRLIKEAKVVRIAVDVSPTAAMRYIAASKREAAELLAGLTEKVWVAVSLNLDVLYLGNVNAK